ncbi:MAG: GNAT family N-acetyltransferase [Kineosporiaceae bacterium]|nr:GNAT family N-acetyltransferase [Kineosporiaceae bacterium]
MSADRGRKSSLVVRPAWAGDAAAIAAVQIAGWRAAYRGIMPDSHLAALDGAARAVFWGSMFDPTGAVRPGLLAPRVAVHGDQVVGFVAIGEAGAAGGADGEASDGVADEGRVFAIYADPAWWGRGVGFVLLSVACEVLRDNGFTLARLWVLADNTRARRFYERLGWAPDGAVQQEDFGGVLLNEVRYACAL